MGVFNIKEKDFSVIINEMDKQIENVDPISYLKTYHIHSILPTLIHLIENIIGFCTQSWFTNIKSVAEEIAERQIIEAKEMVLPPQLYEIFDRCLFKHEQVKLLHGLEITPLQLGGLIIQAGIRGYRFSNYCFRGIPKEYKEKDLPTFIYLKDDGNLDTYGYTTLSNGQLRDLVKRSKFIIARILEKDDQWHCFYQTKSGVQGKEKGDYGSRPHIHYISDSFGTSKEDFIKALKGGRVPSTKIHILLSV